MKKIALICLLVLVAPLSLAITPSEKVAERKSNNVIVASFNIIHFNENRQNMPLVAKVIAKFDLCGVIELETVKAMELLEKELESQTGADWQFVASDETGRGGKIERYAYIWRTDKVALNGKPYILQDEKDIYCNEPFIANFKSGNFDFICVLTHVLWFPPYKKAAEVRALAVDLKKLYDSSPEKDVFLMGDFNTAHDHSSMEDIGKIPGIVRVEPQGVATRVGKDGSMEEEYIDHIFIFNTTSEYAGESGAYNFVSDVYPNAADRKKTLLEVSDHLPVWATFFNDKQDDD